MKITKTESLKKIKDLDKKTMKLFKSNKNGPKVNKMLERLFRLEDKHFKQFGRHPNKDIGHFYNEGVMKL